MFLFRNIIKTKPLRLCLFTLTLNVIFPRVIYVSKRSLFLTFPQQISACTKVSQIFQKSGSHLKILRVRCVTKSNFPTEGPQISGATLRKVLALASRVEQQAVSLSKPDYLFYNYWSFVKFKNAGTCIPPAFLYGLQHS